MWQSPCDRYGLQSSHWEIIDEIDFSAPELGHKRILK